MNSYFSSLISYISISISPPPTAPHHLRLIICQLIHPHFPLDTTNLTFPHFSLWSKLRLEHHLLCLIAFSLVFTISPSGFQLYLATGLFVQTKSHEEDQYIKVSQNSSCPGLESHLTPPSSCRACMPGGKKLLHNADFAIPLSTISTWTLDTTRAVWFLLFSLTSYPGIEGTLKAHRI